MPRQESIGTPGFTVVAAIAAAMTVLSFVYGPDHRMSGEMGLCIPSPNLWDIPPLLSWILNTCILALLVTGAWLLNREYNFIRSPRPVFPAVFLIMLASNPWVTRFLCASTLVCAVNVMSLSILFGCFRKRNCTQEIFVIATFYSLGSMCQYAFLPFLVPAVVSAIAMKAFRFREFMALLLGLAAPYWTGIGLGLIPLSWFRMPELSNLFSGLSDFGELFTLCLSTALAAVLAVIAGLNNSIRLYAGNSRVNAMNLAIFLTGITATACTVLDFSNMTAYSGTVYFAAAVQVANICVIWQLRREWLAVAVPATVYAGFFIVMLLT